MKFQITDLVARIDKLLTRHEAEQAVKAKEAEVKEQKGREDWIAQHQADFLYFAKNIIYKSKKNQPITFEDAPKEIRDRYNSLKFHSTPSGWKADTHHIESLRKLKAALEASTEETVSPTAIKQLGFQDVTFLFTPEAAK